MEQQEYKHVDQFEAEQVMIEKGIHWDNVETVSLFIEKYVYKSRDIAFYDSSSKSLFIRYGV